MIVVVCSRRAEFGALAAARLYPAYLAPTARRPKILAEEHALQPPGRRRDRLSGGGRLCAGLGVGVGTSGRGAGRVCGGGSLGRSGAEWRGGVVRAVGNRQHVAVRRATEVRRLASATRHAALAAGDPRWGTRGVELRPVDPVATLREARERVVPRLVALCVTVM